MTVLHTINIVLTSLIRSSPAPQLTGIYRQKSTKEISCIIVFQTIKL